MIKEAIEDNMHKYLCAICMDDVRESDIECEGPRHYIYVGVDEAPIEEIQEQKFGVYVDPATGKIVKAKALNNPLILG